MITTASNDHTPKLGVPVLPSSTLQRPRLSLPRALEAATEIGRGTIVLMTGPGGAGKTTVMAEWAHDLRAGGFGFGWASLGTDDNDLQTLWTTLLGAIRNALVGLSGSAEPSDPVQLPQSPAARATTALRELRAPTRPNADFVGRLTSLLGDLRDPVWLLLDDVHVIRDGDCLESLNLLLRWVPSTCHVVLGARSDPALHLPRLRLQGRVHEVRNNELRFSVDEAGAALAGHGVQLDVRQVRTLHELTEGWAAGLGLAALALSGGRDPDEFMASFASDTGAMAGYLIDELLDGLPQPTRDFLLLTCVPDRLTPELAEHLSGRDDAGSVLATLAETNSMVSVVVGSTTTYSYHALLRGYLQARLRGLGRIRFEQLHARTATWFSDNGLVVEALEHAVASDDPVVLNALLHRHGVGLLLSGKGDKVARALEAASALVREEAPLQALAALVALDAGQLAAAERHVASAVAERHREIDASARRDAARGVPSGTSSDGSTGAQSSTRDTAAPVRLPTDRLLAVARLSADRIRGEVQAPDADRLHVAVTPPAGSTPRNLRDVDLLERVSSGMTLLATGQYARGSETLDEALGLARRAGFDYTVMVCLTQLAGAAAAMGDMDRMTRSAAAALNYAGPRGWSSSPSLLYAYLFASSAAYAACDLPHARRLSDAAEAILAGDRSPGTDADSPSTTIDVDPLAVVTAQAVASYVSFAEAKGEASAQRSIVRGSLSRVEGLVHGAPAEVAAYQLSEFHRMALMTGQLDLGTRAIELAELMGGIEGDAAAMRGLQDLVRGHDQQARAHVAPVVRGETPAAVVPSTVTALLVHAAVARHNDQPALAHEALLHAVELCDQHHVIRLLVEFSEDTVLALRVGVGRFGRHEQFVDRALHAATHATTHATASSRNHKALAGTASSLTPRELSLLQDLPSLMTIAEIAEARGVSPNTVKTQMRFLFTKLEAGSRREAVATGRRLGLI